MIGRTDAGSHTAMASVLPAARVGLGRICNSIRPAPQAWPGRLATNSPLIARRACLFPRYGRANLFSRRTAWLSFPNQRHTKRRGRPFQFPLLRSAQFRLRLQPSKHQAQRVTESRPGLLGLLAHHGHNHEAIDGRAFGKVTLHNGEVCRERGN